MAAKIRRGDQVRVLSGKNKGAEGAVLSIDRVAGRATVERVNMIWKHLRPNPQTGRGGRIEKEGPLSLSNLMLLHKGEPTRVSFRVVDGKKVRWSKRHDEAIDV